MEAPTFSLDGKSIPYRVRVSMRSRRVSLRFTDTGLEVVRPLRLRSPFVPEPLLERFSDWIRRQVSRRGEAALRHDAMNGRILLRGRELRLDRREADWLGGVGLVRMEPDTLVIEGASGTDGDAAGLLKNWIFSEARRDLGEALRRRSEQMHQPFGRMAVRDQKWLWGSCSPRSGTVSLNARLVMAPPEALDYIVVHELAHFRWRGHGVRFWERVAQFCPDFKVHRRWLRENGWRLRFPDAIATSATGDIRAGQPVSPLL